ncbi:MAG TPA: hypothetical protein VFW47_03505, partial [Phenylobacterium sp.]|nr:hypothetical protein [Phenylobacterium sp.]
MTLGEWLNRMILEEDGPEDISSEAYFTDPNYSPRPSSERPVRTYYETARPVEPLIRPEVLREPPSRFEAPEHPADEISRVTMALDRLTQRIESSEGRTGMAITGVEHSVREAVARIESAEREHVAIAARFEGAVEDTRAEQSRLAERLRRMEAEAAGPRSAEALRALEQALGRVASHLYQGESETRETLALLRERIEKAEAGSPAPSVDVIEEVVDRVGTRLNEAEIRTAEALEGLRASFAGLDTRLSSVEGGATPGLDLRLEQLSERFSQRLEATRGELAKTLHESAEGRFDRMERKLSEMAEQVRAAEQRSAQAIERVGREVLTVADNLNRRVEASETRNTDAIEQVGGEIARIAQTVETKLNRTDSIQAEAMEKLGAEIARISERLAERIANAERRSAQAIDDVGEQISRVNERIGQRGETSSSELVERIRLSEERTARLLEEAREKIDQRLGETQRRISEQMAAAPALQTPVDPSKLFGEPEPFPSFKTLEEEAEPVVQVRAMQPPGLMTRSGFATPPPRPKATPPAAAGAQAAAAAYETPQIHAPEAFHSEDGEPEAFEAEAPKAFEPETLGGLTTEALMNEALALEPESAEAEPDESRAFGAEPFPSAQERRTFDADDFEAADGFAAVAEDTLESDDSLEAFGTDRKSDEFAADLELAEKRNAEPTFGAPAPELPEPPTSYASSDFEAPEPAATEFERATFTPAAESEADQDSGAFETAAFHGDETATEDGLDQGAFHAARGSSEESDRSAQPLSTREVIEQARAAARAAVENDGRGRLGIPRRLKAEKVERPGAASESIFTSLFA